MDLKANFWVLIYLPDAASKIITLPLLMDVLDGPWLRRRVRPFFFLGNDTVTHSSLMSLLSCILVGGVILLCVWFQLGFVFPSPVGSLVGHSGLGNIVECDQFSHILYIVGIHFHTL